MREFIIAGNWKMNTTLNEGIDLFHQINKLSSDEEWDSFPSSTFQILVFPPFTHLYPLKEIPTKNILLGAQNCSSEAKGAFTGEVAPNMIASLKIHFVLIGHSERRAIYGETSEILKSKVNQALSSDLIPVFCVGETRQERESGNYYPVIENQIKESLFHLEPNTFSKVVIAYEPVWAIGTGLTASPDQAQEVHQFIRNLVAEKYSGFIAQDLTILYGGSVNEKNANDLFSRPDIDGGLVGGASLKAKEFIEIAKSLSQQKNHHENS